MSSPRVTLSDPRFPHVTTPAPSPARALAELRARRRLYSRPSYTYTSQAALRSAFWDAHPQLVCRRGPRGRILPQNSQPTTTRVVFCDWLDSLHRDGQISDALAQRATL